MGNLGYKAIDVDNHYYEPLDAFTRHLDKKFRRRGVQMFSDGRHTQAVIGDRVNRFVPNPTFDPIIEPGCLDLLFRGQIPEGVDPASLMKVERLAQHPEYQNRDARITVMDTQGIETVFMLPTFACGVEEALKHDVDATMASLHAFNLWLDEDWGFDRPDHRLSPRRSFRWPIPPRLSKRWSSCWGAARSWYWCGLRRCPVWSSRGRWAIPSMIRCGPRWPRRGVPVGFHLSDSGYLQIAGMWGGRSTFEGFGGSEPLEQILTDDRAIHDTMASMIVHGVFTRHPKLKAVSIENGSYFVHRLIKRMKKAANSHPRLFPEDPVEQLRNNVWVAPYYEDDLAELADAIGVDKILFGSDWPHGEGLEDPVSFTEELAGFSDADVRKVMRDNALDLLDVKVGSAA